MCVKEEKYRSENERNYQGDKLCSRNSYYILKTINKMYMIGKYARTRVGDGNKGQSMMVGLDKYDGMYWQWNCKSKVLHINKNT